MGGVLSEYEFRSKKRHEWSLTLAAKIKKPNGKEVEYHRMASLDPYYHNFLEGNTYRESCYQCPYSQPLRPGDITIGDFWGIENCYPELFDIRGVSCAIVNSFKGKEFWAQLSSVIESHQVRLDYIVNNNGNLREPTRRKSIRDHIYKNVNQKGFGSIPYDLPVRCRIIDTIKNYLPNKWRYAVKTFLKPIINFVRD